MGRITEEKIKVTCTDEERTLRIWLPESYNTSSTEYPVIYMHDGQNVFDDSTATFGRGWRVAGILEKLEEEGVELIVIALDCSPERRFDEYSPFVCEIPQVAKLLGAEGGLGDGYREFFVEQLVHGTMKKYRINRNKAAILGSSMGGLISAYIALEHPEIFCCAGVFSLASWFAEQSFLNYVYSRTLKEEQRFFVYVGTNETHEGIKDLHKQYLLNTFNFTKALLSLGITPERLSLNIENGGIHNEASWEKYTEKFIRFFLDK